MYFLLVNVVRVLSEDNTEHEGWAMIVLRFYSYLSLELLNNVIGDNQA